MSDRFDFEQQIVKCWSITDEIGEVSEAIFERNLSVDQIVNALTGLQQMYDLKFNKLWDLFEDVHMNLVRENKMLNEECSAMREQLEQSDPDTHGYGIAAIKPNKVNRK